MNDFTSFLREIFSAWRNPTDYGQKALKDLREESAKHLASLREKYGPLDIRPKEAARIARFETLEQAVDFIASCLEENAIEELAADILSSRERIQHDSSYPYYFAEGIFMQLQRIHQERNLRDLYADRRFPQDQNTYTLGGHASELECIHIDFAKRGNFWIISDMWLCR